MRQQRLVEVECIDDVIEQLKHVRDNYETEHDEQGMELATVKQQRDELLAALLCCAEYRLPHDATMLERRASEGIFMVARAAIAKTKGGEG
jgi:hypothetical protein